MKRAKFAGKYVVVGDRPSLSTHPFEAICSQCHGPAYSDGGGSLWCATCLEPLVVKGEAFVPSIEVKRVAK